MSSLSAIFLKNFAASEPFFSTKSLIVKPRSMASTTRNTALIPIITLPRSWLPVFAPALAPACAISSAACAPALAAACATSSTACVPALAAAYAPVRPAACAPFFPVSSKNFAATPGARLGSNGSKSRMNVDSFADVFLSSHIWTLFSTSFM